MIIIDVMNHKTSVYAFIITVTFFRWLFLCFGCLLSCRHLVMLLFLLSY